MLKELMLVCGDDFHSNKPLRQVRILMLLGHKGWQENVEDSNFESLVQILGLEHHISKVLRDLLLNTK